MGNGVCIQGDFWEVILVVEDGCVTLTVVDYEYDRADTTTLDDVTIKELITFLESLKQEVEA